MTAATILVNDFSRFRPANNLCSWIIKPENMASAGRVLMAPFDRQARELRYNPGLKSWHRISIGLYNPSCTDRHIPLDRRHQYHSNRITGVNIKLSSDPFFDFIQCSTYEAGVEDLVFKTADLTGEEVIISQPDGYPVYFDYLKFTPVKPEKVVKQRPWCIGAINDFFSFNYDQLLKTPADLKRCVWLHRQAGFSRIYWMTAGGSCFYRTKIGTNFSDKLSRNLFYRRFMENHDVLSLAYRHCRSAGLEIYHWFRINNEYGGAVKDLGKSVVSKFWLKHPEFRDVDSNGKTTLWWLSFAYPEVWEYKIALAREMLAYGADGLLIDTQRHPPMTQYAPPVVKSFKAAFGVDPFRLPEDDPRWLRHKATFFTGFMRRLRQAVRAIDPVLKIAIRVAKHPGQCLKEGVDVEALVKENLVDELMPSTHVYFGLFSLQAFLPILAGSRCRLHGCINPYLPRGHDPGVHGEPVWPMVKPLYASGDQFVAQTEIFRKEGAVGAAFYESEAIVTRPGIRGALKEIGKFNHG